MDRLKDRLPKGARTSIEEYSRVDRLSYLTWSCNALGASLESEHTRADGIRRNAHAAFLVPPALIGIALQSDIWKNDDVEMSWLRLALVLLGAATILCWFMVMRLKLHPRVSVRIFTDDEGTTAEHNYEARLVRARDYLVGAVKSAQDVGSELATWRSRSLFMTVTTILVAGVPFILHEVVPR